jgi:hypothetical protein
VAPAIAHVRRGALAGHIATRIAGKSTGVVGRGEEPIGDSLGALVKGLAFPASMAADLAVVEDQGQGIGKKPDHGEHHQGRGLVDGGVFEVTIVGDGLKDFGIDSPTAAAELMNEQGRDGTELEIGGVEVGALLRGRGLAFGSLTIFFTDRDAPPLFDANRFDDPHQTVGDRPIDFRQVPISDLPVCFGVNAGGRCLRQAFGLAQ